MAPRRRIKTRYDLSCPQNWTNAKIRGLLQQQGINPPSNLRKSQLIALFENGRRDCTIPPEIAEQQDRATPDLWSIPVPEIGPKVANVNNQASELDNLVLTAIQDLSCTVKDLRSEIDMLKRMTRNANSLPFGDIHVGIPDRSRHGPVEGGGCEILPMSMAMISSTGSMPSPCTGLVHTASTITSSNTCLQCT